MTERDQPNHRYDGDTGRHGDRDPYAPPGFDAPRTPPPTPSWALPDADASRNGAAGHDGEWTVVEPRIRNVESPETLGSTEITGPIPVVGSGNDSPGAPPASPVDTAGSVIPTAPAAPASSAPNSPPAPPAAPRPAQPARPAPDAQPTRSTPAAQPPPPAPASFGGRAAGGVPALNGPVGAAPAPHPPSLADLRAGRPASPEGPATSGWRAGLRRATGGLIKLGPNEQELRLRRAKESVQRSLRGPRTVVVINTKGGGGKTTAVYSLAATFGQARGGYVLGWDNNETRGTLAWRAAAARHSNTAVDLLRDLERFEDPRNARVGDLDNYVRSQGSAQFDVLASDENAASAASIDDQAFRSLHRSLSRFYRLLIVDTGNNVKAPNWGAAVELADQIVVVSSIREDTAGGASWTLDHLMELGMADKVAKAVTILSAPRKDADTDQRAKLERFRTHFAARTRAVLEVPFDPALVDGDSIVFEALSPATRRAWLLAAAAIAEGL